MASDIKILWDSDLVEGDIKLEDEDLVREEGLETSVIMSLFTDRRAQDDDILDDPDDKRGWWGDRLENEGDDIEDYHQIGSRLWVIERASTTNANLQKAKIFIEEALEWMIEDGVASTIEVEVERQGRPENAILAFKVIITKSDGIIEEYTYDDVWNSQFGL